MGEYSKALSYFEQALEIFQKTIPPNYPKLTAAYSNIGMVYNNMGEYSKALSYLEQVLEIRQKTLPANHPDLAGSYNNIGVVYGKMGEYSKTLSYYEQALEIQTKNFFRPIILDLAISYNNIGDAVQATWASTPKPSPIMNKHWKFDKKSLPANHPNLAGSYNNIGVVYEHMGEYSKALSYYEQALEIYQKDSYGQSSSFGYFLQQHRRGVQEHGTSIPKPFHIMNKYWKSNKKLFRPIILIWLFLITTSQGCTSTWTSTLKSFRITNKHWKSSKKLFRRIIQTLATSYNNIGMVYDKMGEHSKALSYYGTSTGNQTKKLFRPIILIWLFLTAASHWCTTT